MKRLLRLICSIFFVGYLCSSYSQNTYAPLEKVSYKNNKLNFVFKNCSDTLMYAPIMKLRKGIESPYLYKEYWNIENNNTLVIKLSNKVSPDLYTLINREGGESSAVLLYTDKLLKPHKRFKTSIPFILPENIDRVKIGGFIIPICR